MPPSVHKKTAPMVEDSGYVAENSRRRGEESAPSGRRKLRQPNESALTSACATAPWAAARDRLTVRTGQGAVRTTRSATLPSRACMTAPRP